MHIALINSWPNLASSAEIDFTRRFRRAAEKLGHRAFEVVTSDDIIACNPDFAIALSEISPKLTSIPTFGAMWTPPLRYDREPRWLRSVRSYDGYLVGSDVVRAYLKDLEFSLGAEKPKSGFLFLPTVSFEGLPDGSDFRPNIANVAQPGRHGDETDLVAA